jgi:hypothetical protein
MFGYIYLGVALKSYSAPLLVIVGCILTTLYLAWSGKSGIAISSAWIVLVMAVATIGQVNPRYQVNPSIQTTMSTLLFHWGYGFWLTEILSKLREYFLQRRMKRRQAFSRIAVVSLNSLLLGLALSHST